MTTFADLARVPAGARVRFAWALTLEGVPAGATGRITDNDLFPPVKLGPKLTFYETAPIDLIVVEPVTVDGDLTSRRPRA